MAMLNVTLEVFRYKPGLEPHYDTFAVQIADTAFVIDALDEAWALYDHSLTFRHACHHSSCGSCALRVNGVEKLPCITRVIDVMDEHHTIRLDPLRNFPIVSDLVVDVKGFFQRMSASHMKITSDAETVLPLTVDKPVPGVQAEEVELAEGLQSFNRFENCIECGICQSACPTMAVDDKFFGPAGLAAIYRACQQSDDPDEKAHLLALANGEHGVWRCHSAFECMEACPQAVDPAGKIMALRWELMTQRLQKSGKR
ncbi:MAG TPA: 2Fe-2S iron-sulfur cluster-binding protein [Ktedonobacteraceae bacterium]|nr:2Fe-2S iron-sulfur cluster-binding protein [Ktedonobacteraceae bacterium]